MNDDDFLDRLLNSSGDDLDRLIQNDKSKRLHKRSHDDIEVDMSDIEKILNSKSPLEDDIQKIKSSSKVVEVSTVSENFPDKSEECFKRIYEQLTTEDYCIDRISALQKSSQREQRIKITTLVIKIILVAIGISICLGGAIFVSQILMKLFPV